MGNLQRMALLALVAAAALVCGGCGERRPQTAPVIGTVTYRGQPVEGATVVFAGAAGRPSMGITDATGEFTLTTFKPRDGALPGEHAVTVTKAADAGNDVIDVRGPASVVRPVLPMHYGAPARTPLRATVVLGGTNTFSFDLTD